MTDWTKQAEEMMKTWTKAQQQLWDSWKAALPTAGTAQTSESWGKMVDMWKEALDRTLDTQVEWTNMWANSVKSQANTPKELTAWADQMVSTMKSWTESQAGLWDSVLDSMKQATPETLVQRMDEGTRMAFQTWQDAVGKAVEAQKDLSKRWTAGKPKE
jgi:hypothetical protein